MDIKIIVATHKKCEMPSDSLYYPVQVGAEGKANIGYQRDCEGENISSKNPYYCELTGVYWAWKNLHADYVGLVHYRRMFRIRRPVSKDQKMECILDSVEAENLLREHDLVLPRRRNYIIESVYGHYCHTHHQHDLDMAGTVLQELYPDYYPTYVKRMRCSWAHMFNMFIMKWELFDQYCSWIFPILEELETRLDLTGYTPFEARVYGRISELLLDVWVDKNHLSYKEIPFIYIGKVNWGKKIGGFLEAKFLGKGYKESF